MTDAVGVVADERHRVDPADQQVAGVEAPGDVGVRERLLDVVRGLDQRADVRVQDELEALGGDEVGERAQVRARALPAVVVERRRARTSSRSCTSAATNTLGAAPAASWPRRARACSRVGARSPSCTTTGTKPADEAQAVAVELARHGGAVERQPAQRPELGGRQPELGHLGQHALGRELQAPARDLADAPRDRGSRQPRPIGDARPAPRSLISSSGALVRALQRLPRTLALAALQCKSFIGAL